MAVDLDNIDSVMKGLAKLEKAAEMEVIREVRKKFKATMRKFIPVFKKVTPKRSGDMIKTVKTKSRSRKGRTKVTMQWGTFYAGFVNFDKDKPGSEGFASDKYFEIKESLEQDAVKDIKDSFKAVFNRHGVKVK